MKASTKMAAAQRAREVLQQLDPTFDMGSRSCSILWLPLGQQPTRVPGTEAKYDALH